MALNTHTPNSDKPQSSVDMFAKITGVKQGWIQGESEDSKHKNEIDIASYQFGVNQGFDAHTNLATGRRQYQKFTLHMLTSVATPKLLSCCSCNEVLKSVVITCRKAGGKQQEYMTWTLTNASIAELKTGYVTEDDLIPHDVMSLVFQKIEYDYKPQKSDGSLGAGVCFVDDFQARV